MIWTLLWNLWRHRALFTNPDLNELAEDQRTEWHCYILEQASQNGFEWIDDDANVMVCTSRQVVGLVAPYKRGAETMRHLAEGLGQDVLEYRRALVDIVKLKGNEQAADIADRLLARPVR